MKKPTTKSQKENKVKKSNHSKSIEPLSNSASWLDYMAEEALRFFPEKDAWRKRLCYTIHLWSLTDDALEIQQFCDLYRMSYPTLLSMAQRYSDIGAAYADAKRRIAARKRILAAKNQLNSNVFRDIHRYDPEWIPLMKELEDIKKDSAQLGNQVVVIEKFPEEDK